MIKIGSFDAKTHFSDIIQKANKGEEYLITKNGKPMARILPPETGGNIIKESAARILKRRAKYTSSQKEIRSFIEEGRKY
jgi:prevent-host-death family protein